MTIHTMSIDELEYEMTRSRRVLGFIVRILPRTAQDWARIIDLYKLLILVGVLYVVQVRHDSPPQTMPQAASVQPLR